MKKKLFIIIIILILGICVFFLYNYLYEDNNKIIEENYDDVKILENIVIDVFDQKKISDFVTIIDGKIINDDLLESNIIGEQKIEVHYFNRDEVKYKAYFNVNIVDKIKPIILGGSSFALKVGNNLDLNYMLFSADNYDGVLKREVTGEYDYNKIGKYDLNLKVTDSSNNSSSKNFTINVVSEIKKPVTKFTETKFEDIIKIHKNDRTKIGLDVSRWQEKIDFNLLKTNGVEFIMIRVGFQQGFNGENVLDSYFLDNIKGASLSGIPVGLYFYSYASTKEEAKDQALWVIDQIKDYNVDLPISFDWESWSKFSTLNISLHQINLIAKEFIKTIEQNGYKGINYGSKYYLENVWNTFEYPTWLAHYTKQTDYKGKYMMWQLCNDGKIPGINGAVDINVLYE